MANRCALWFPGERATGVYGYGRVRVQTIDALRRAGFAVVDGGFEAPENVIQISHYQPFNSERYERVWKPRPEAKFRILYTTFESSNLPDGWAENAALFDAIWTTSAFCVELFERELGFIGRSDIPVFCIPHGIDSFQFPPLDRRFTDPRPFLFYTKGIHPADRKQADQVMRVFEKMDFKGRAKLLVKATPSAHKRGQFRNFNHVTLVSEWWTDQQQLGALFNANCFVQPTRCEGFGLEPLEAMATGCPVITTPYSGIREYYLGAHELFEHINVEGDWGKHSKGHWYKDPTIEVGGKSTYGISLPFVEGPAFYNAALEDYKKQLELGQIPEENRRPELENDDWDFGVDAIIEDDDLAAAMEFAYKEILPVSEIAKRSAYYVHRDWTWNHAVGPIVRSLEALGLLDSVHWSKGESTKWLDFINRANVDSEFKNWPLTVGTEELASEAVVDDDSFLKV